jgi:hypothetical protein
MARHTPEQRAYGAACIEVLREIDRQERPERFATHTAWAKAAGIRSKSTISEILAGEQIPTAQTLRKLIRAVRVSWTDFQARVQSRSADAVAFQGSVLPSTLAQITPPGLLMRWSSYSLAVTREELLGSNVPDGTPLVSVVLARHSSAFQANLAPSLNDRVAPVLRHHPLVQTPFMYMRLEQAHRLEKIYDEERATSRLLVLRDWAMELKPATFGLIRLDRERLEPTELSGFHRAFSQSPEAAQSYLKGKFTNRPTIIYEYEAAEDYLDALEDYALGRLRVLKEARKPGELFERKRTGYTSGALQLMDLELLDENCLLAVQHAQLWALRREPRSRFHILFTNEQQHLLPPDLLWPDNDLPPYDVIVVREGAVRKPSLDMGARWFAEVGRKLIVAWKERPSEIVSFLFDELDKYVPGIGYTKDALTGLVHEGLKLHIGPGPHAFVPIAEAVSRFKEFHRDGWPSTGSAGTS